MAYKNILIVKLSAIGDVIHALPVPTALKQCFPDARITWIVEKPAYDLLVGHPHIDEIMIFDKPKFKKITSLIKAAPPFIKELKSRKFDLTIDLQGLFKSAAIAFLSGANSRLVYENSRELSNLLSSRICGQHQYGHVVERYLDVVRAIGCQVEKPQFVINISPKEQQLADSIAVKAGLQVKNQYVILAPGANWPNKCWPLAHFAKLADYLYEKEIIPVVIGGANDRRLYSDIAAKCAVPPIDLTGKTSLKQLAYIIQNALSFIGGDTGPMHLAAALGTPVVALYGPTDIIRNGPYGEVHTALTVSRECTGCWKRKCPLDYDCLEPISPESVYEFIMRGSTHGN